MTFQEIAAIFIVLAPGIAAAVGVQHRCAAIPEPVHADRIRRHVEFLGDQTEGWHEVAGARTG